MDKLIEYRTNDSDKKVNLRCIVVILLLYYDRLRNGILPNCRDKFADAILCVDLSDSLLTSPR